MGMVLEGQEPLSPPWYKSGGFVGTPQEIKDPLAIAVSVPVNYRGGTLKSSRVVDRFNKLANKVGVPVVVTGARVDNYYVYTGTGGPIMVDSK